MARGRVIPRQEADSAEAVDGAEAADAVDERLPFVRLAPLAAQHLLVLIAAPVSSVFMVAGALHLSAARTASLLSAVLVFCGIGALLQSFGVLRVGGRLPFLMLPGGAAVAIFIQIAQAHGAATATGSVLLSAALLLAVLPLYARIARFFPPVVMGTVVVLIGVNMVKTAGGLIVGRPGAAGYAEPRSTVLALVTVAAIALFFLVLRGVWRQMAVLGGLAVGCAVAACTGLGSFAYADGPAVVALPRPLPFGAPHFDVVAALPMLVFALASLAEATGQTVLNSEAVGRTPDPARDVPRVARADAVVSLVGGCFGTSLMVTAAENVGIVQLTGVRSRFVTAGAGVLLVVVGLFAPVARGLAAIPAPVVGGCGLMIYAVIAVMGIRMLGRVDFDARSNGTVVALALAVGLLPVMVPDLYRGFPGWLQTVLGSGVVAGALTAVALGALFRHRSPRTAV